MTLTDPRTPRGLYAELFSQPGVRPRRILNYEVVEGVPEDHPFGQCNPMDEDPKITVDPRLWDAFWYMTALHEIAHCRAKTYIHGYRFARSLNAVWKDAEGFSPIPAAFFSMFGRQLLSRPVILGWELAAAARLGGNHKERSE